VLDVACGAGHVAEQTAAVYADLVGAELDRA
jgi:cyclopropane fatty-acyl-phospholipid synthase-like methyltransferase